MFRIVFTWAVCIWFSRRLELVKLPDVARAVCTTTPVTDTIFGSAGGAPPALAALVVTSTYR